MMNIEERKILLQKEIDKLHEIKSAKVYIDRDYLVGLLQKLNFDNNTIDFIIDKDLEIDFNMNEEKKLIIMKIKLLSYLMHISEEYLKDNYIYSEYIIE